MDAVFHDNSMDMKALKVSYYIPQRCRSRGGGGDNFQRGSKIITKTKGIRFYLLVSFENMPLSLSGSLLSPQLTLLISSLTNLC